MAHKSHPLTRKLLLVVVLLAAVAFVIIVSAHSSLHILEAVQRGDNKEDTPGIAGFSNAIDSLKGPANVTVGSLGGLGVAVGSAMIAVGSPKGLKTVGASAGAIAALLLGNGIIK